MGTTLRIVPATPPVERIDLHIGIEKTGSSAIQAFLQTHRVTLAREHAVLFPRSLGARLSVNLAAACQGGEKPDDLRKIRGLLTDAAVCAYRSELRENLTDEIRRERPRRLVISCEHLSSRLPQPLQIARLREFLAGLALEIRIWVYLRRQDAFQLSLYSTAVRSGRSTPFAWPEVGRERQELHYARLLRRWSEVFGREAIYPRLFEANRLFQGDIVSDFCHALGLRASLPRPQKAVNRSLNQRQLALLRALNERIPRFVDNTPNAARGDLPEAVESLDLAGERLAAGPEAATYLARFAEGNRLVARDWFGQDRSVPANLFAPIAVAPAVSWEPAELSESEFLDACEKLWTHSQNALAAQRGENQLLRAELALERGQLSLARRLLQACRTSADAKERNRLLAKLARAEARGSRAGSSSGPARPDGTTPATADPRAG